MSVARSPVTDCCDDDRLADFFFRRKFVAHEPLGFFLTEAFDLPIECRRYVELILRKPVMKFDVQFKVPR